MELKSVDKALVGQVFVVDDPENKFVMVANPDDSIEEPVALIYYDGRIVTDSIEIDRICRGNF